MLQVDTVEGGGCVSGCGADVAGTVVACPGCTRLRVGDAVWTLANLAYSDYVVAPETFVGRKPTTLAFGAAGTRLPHLCTTLCTTLAFGAVGTTTSLRRSIPATSLFIRWFRLYHEVRTRSLLGNMISIWTRD